MNVVPLRPRRRLRCRLGLHKRVWEVEDAPHPLTPMVRQNWLRWGCRYCNARGQDLLEYEVIHRHTTTMVVAGFVFLTVAGGILDTV